ncbi:MAG: S9 family peptidase [Planctomycetes bacterium]|nr:S9 family peptidase [Planctomycetota bacterium]
MSSSSVPSLALAGVLSFASVCPAQDVALEHPASRHVASHAATPDVAPLVPRHALFAEPSAWSVSLAPDGRHAAWLASGDRGVELRVADVSQPEAARACDVDAPRAYRFTADGRLLVVAAAPAGGDRLVLLDPSGTKPSPDASAALGDLSPRPGSPLSLDARQPTPDDTCVVLTDDGAYEITLPASGADDAPTPARALDVPAETAVLLVDGRRRPRAAWCPDERGEATLMRCTSAGWVSHGHCDWASARVSGPLSVSSDGRTLYAVHDLGRDRSALFAIDVESGAETLLADDPLADVLPAGATIAADGSVQAVVSYFGRLRRTLLDPSLARDFERLATAIPGETSFAGRSADDARWLVRSLDGGPLECFVYDRASGRATHLVSEQPQLDGVLLAGRRAVSYATRDGTLVPGHVYLPPGSDADGDGRPERPLPTIFYVHGGPWVGGEWNSWFTNRSFQLLANRGYAVMRVDFRGAGGYGRAFMDSGNAAWDGVMRTDLLDAVAWAVDTGVSDPQRLACWGWSYGAYAVTEAMASTPDVFACGLAMYGVYDLVSFVQGIEAMGGSRLWRERVGEAVTPEGRAALWRASPQSLVAQIRAPLLVTHGGLDERTPQSQSDAFVAALREAGRDVPYLVYPDEPHDYRRPESWESFWAEGERFLAEHLGGRAEPLTDEHERAGVRFG